MSRFLLRLWYSVCAQSQLPAHICAWCRKEGQPHQACVEEQETYLDDEAW